MKRELSRYLICFNMYLCIKPGAGHNNIHYIVILSSVRCIIKQIQDSKISIRICVEIIRKGSFGVFFFFLKTLDKTLKSDLVELANSGRQIEKQS